MKKILITGAPGYIGSHLTKRCAELGFLVDGLDNDWNQNDITKFLHRKIDVDIRHIMNPLGSYDAVLHLAAMTMVQPSVLNPELYYHTNIMGTSALYKACETDNFIYCSTGAAFNPTTSPYAMSKRAGEDIVTLTPNHSICRFYNVGGNDGFKKYDGSHYHLIRKAAAVVNGLYDHIEVYGNDYDTRDGTTIRNYTHISDIVDSMIKIIEHGPTNNVECLGNIKGYSVLEVIAAMERVTNKKLKVEYKDRRLGDSVVSILPTQSEFFVESRTLEDQCLSTLDYEK